MYWKGFVAFQSDVLLMCMDNRKILSEESPIALFVTTDHCGGLKGVFFEHFDVIVFR